MSMIAGAALIFAGLVFMLAHGWLRAETFAALILGLAGGIWIAPYVQAVLLT